MYQMKKFYGCAVVVAVLLVVLGLPSVGKAGPDPCQNGADTVVEFGIYPLTSVVNGITATQSNPPTTPYVYTFTVHSGDPLTDTIPLKVCLDSKTDGCGTCPGDCVSSWSDQVAFNNAAGGFASSIAATGSPWSFDQSSPTSDGTHSNTDTGCQSGSLTINVPSGVLTNIGNNVYTTNIFFKLQNNSNSTGKPKLVDSIGTQHIQIQVNVLQPEGAGRTTCFMTDSACYLLMDCEGKDVTESGSDDGTFAIVFNKKKTPVAVATNPGQFYYNLLWRNDTGSNQTVNVDMALEGLVANGAQAVHWLTFPTSGFGGVIPSNFNQVIEGNPAGHSGQIFGIFVQDGYTLYVTYHLEWAGLGSNFADYGSCGDEANTGVSVTGSVTGTFSGSPDTCPSGAIGYNKQ